MSQVRINKVLATGGTPAYHEETCHYQDWSSEIVRVPDDLPEEMIVVDYDAPVIDGAAWSMNVWGFGHPPEGRQLYRYAGNLSSIRAEIFMGPKGS